MASTRPLVGSIATTVPFMLPRASIAAWRTIGSSPAVTSPEVMSSAKELMLKRSCQRCRRVLTETRVTFALRLWARWCKRRRVCTVSLIFRDWDLDFVGVCVLICAAQLTPASGRQAQTERTRRSRLPLNIFLVFTPGFYVLRCTQRASEE